MLINKKSLFILFFLFYLLCGATLPVTDPVEATYALSAKEMVLHGNWLAPTLFGGPWFDKPILFYLLTAVLFKLFGVSAFVAHIIPAVFAAASVTIIFWFVSRFTSRREGLVAALILGSSLQFLVMSKLIVTDMVLFFFSNAALVFFYSGYKEKETRLRWYIVAYACAAMAVLTKGPVGLLIPGIIILAFLVYQKNLAELKHLFHPVGLIVFLIISLPWYVEMAHRFGNDFVSTFFGLHNYLRATVSEHPRDNVFYYYPVLFIISTLPWTMITLRAMYDSLIACWRRTIDEWSVFSLFWAGIYLLFYSLMATKYPTYTFPALFPAVILTAQKIERSQINLAKFLQPAICFLTIIFVGLSAFYSHGAMRTIVIILLAVMFYYTFKKMSGTPVLTGSIYTLTAFFIVCGTSLANLAFSHSGVALSQTIQGYGATPIGIYRSYSTSAVFYSGANLIKLEDRISQAGAGNVWRSKYHIPTQSIEEYFQKDNNAAPALVVVMPKDQIDFEKVAAGRQYMNIISLKP